MKIAIVGLGYVGLPLSLQFSRSGVHVIGLDIDRAKIDSLRSGKSYIRHISSDAICSAFSDGLFEVSSDFSRVSEVEAVIICVPTPLTKQRNPDTSYVMSTARSIGPFLSPQKVRAPALAAVEARSIGASGELEETRSNGYCAGDRVKLVVLESTSYPGMTDEDLRTVLEKYSGLEAGSGFHLAFSPEREDPGNRQSDVGAIPKVIGGLTPACRARAIDLYKRAISDLVPVSSCGAAEATKLLEDVFRRVKIAL